MGLIIKDKIQQMIVGYPTVSDKYNVGGGILASGSSAVKFGDLVKFTTTPGYYAPATSMSAVSDVAGLALATNVKLAQDWPGQTVQVNAMEAFNLLLNGFAAVELDSGADETDITPNAKVYVILATGKLTTSSKASSGTIVELPGYVFTGLWETQGTKIVAEVFIK